MCRREKRKEEGSQNEAASREGLSFSLSVDRLVLFLAYVINCSEQVKTKTKKIKVIVKAAAKFLNMTGLSWEKVEADLKQGEGCLDGVRPSK